MVQFGLSDSFSLGSPAHLSLCSSVSLTRCLSASVSLSLSVPFGLSVSLRLCLSVYLSPCVSVSVCLCDVMSMWAMHLPRSAYGGSMPRSSRTVAVTMPSALLPPCTLSFRVVPTVYRGCGAWLCDLPYVSPCTSYIFGKAYCETTGETTR